MKQRQKWNFGAWLILAACAASAFARAGGGEGYHGSGGGGGSGGGSGFGGGGGGSGNGGSIYWIIQFALYHPLIALLIAIVAGLYFYYNRGNSEEAMGAPAQRLVSSSSDALAALRQADPSFDLEQFQARVTAAFLKIQEAWSHQDLTSIRPFISDGIHERFGLQYLEQKDQHYRNALDNVSVQRVALVESRIEGGFDVAAMRIEAHASDYNVSLADGKRLGTSAGESDFAEYWSFIRRRGAQSKPGQAGLMEGACPNCGAPNPMNAGSKCVQCGALLRSGQYDWVLAEITQEEAWRAHRAVEVPGVDAMLAGDPRFNTLDLADSASVMFWRIAMADRSGKIDPMRKIAHPDLLAARAAAAKASPPGERTYFGNCAVGSIEPVGLFPASPPEPMDRALLQVKWAASQFQAKSGAALVKSTDQTLMESYFVLERKRGVKTDPGKSVSSAHCPNCGAPSTVDTANACEYCGVVLNDGSLCWVLLEAGDASSAKVQELLGQVR